MIPTLKNYYHLASMLFSLDEIKDNILTNQMDKLLIIIKSSIHEKGINGTFDFVKKDYFNLRMWVLQNMSSKIHFDNELVNKNIVQKTVLSKAIIESIDTYSLFLNPLIQGKLVEEMQDSIEKKEIDFTTVSWDFLDNFQEIPIMRTLKKFIDTNLLFDFYLFIAFLIERKKIEVSDDLTKELITKLYSSIEELGLYFTMLEIWNPIDLKEETQLMRNIKIRVSFEKSKQKKSAIYSKDAIKDMLL